MQVNPSINIAIGNYGKSCNDSFHNHFMEREKDLRNYASFYCLSEEVNLLKYFAVNQNGLNESITINDQAKPDELFASDDIQFFLKGFINSIYNNQINLLSQLNSDVNFQIVSVNLILSSFEGLNAELAGNLIKNIKELCDEGMIGHIVVKAFVILSKDENLLNKQEEIVAYKNLEKLKVIQQDNNSIFSNIIFIDDKNTSAVYLDINPISIGLVLNELITYLMTNHYNMLGNLMNSDFLSIGIGMIYFDEKYFRNFFKSKIIDAKIVQEQLDPEEHLITTSHYTKIKNEYFIPVVKKTGKIEISSLADTCKVLELPENCTLKSYKFLLSHLLGDFKAVSLTEPLLNVEKISIYDTLYQLIKNSFPVLGGIDIQEHKILLDEIDDLNIQLKEYNNNNEEGFLDEIIAGIEKNILDKNKQAKTEKLEIKNTLNKFKKKDQPKLKEQIGSQNDRIIQELQKKRETLKATFKQKFCLLRLFDQRDYRQQINAIDRNVEQIKKDQQGTQQTFEKLSVEVLNLYKVIEELEKKYKNLNQAIETIFEFQKSCNSEYENSELFNYLFINHVIDKKILKQYFKEHHADLLTNLKDSIVQLNSIQPFSQKKYGKYLIERIDETISGIIDFKMVGYLLNKYDHLKLLKKANAQDDISDLIKISVPFFNADNAFINNNSHCLILHKELKEIDTKNLRESLGNVFHVVPQQIRTLNPNKFSLVKIDVIPNFASLVKYNMGKKRYEKEKLETK